MTSPSRNPTILRWLLAVVLGCLWAGSTWSEYQSFQLENTGVNEEVVLRYYDREIRLSDATKRSGWYGDWVSGADQSAHRAQLGKAIDQLYLGELGEDEEILRGILKPQTGKIANYGFFTDLQTNEKYRKEYREWLLKENPPSWHFEHFLRAVDDKAIRTLYSAANDRLLKRAIVSSIAWDILFLVGLACLVICIRSRSSALPAPKFPLRWNAPTLLSLFFAANLLLGPWIALIGIFYPLMELMFQSEQLAYSIYDLYWRAFPAVCLALCLLRFPNQVWRVFGLGRRHPIAWKLFFAALTASYVLEMLIFWISPEKFTDPTDFFYYADVDLPHMLGVFFTSVILAPVFEEIVFRGFLFQGLRRGLGVVGAGLVSTLLFALVHMQYDVWGIISVAITGFTAAYLTYRTGSIKTAIIFHSVINLWITMNTFVVYQLSL